MWGFLYDKIYNMKNKRKTIFSLGVVAAAIVVILITQNAEQKTQIIEEVFSEYVRYDTAEIRLANGNVVPVYLADNPRVRTRGLSNKTYLPKDEGMLFVFEESGLHSFWMRSMNFSIDMVWINEEGTVVHLESNVAPETYPELFVSTEPALYVLELNAGYAKELGLRVGTKVEIEL